jgi:deoxyribodipyrimidine photo-lyase
VSTRIYWFRSDLRLHDHPGLQSALAGATRLLPVYCHDPCDDEATPWGFVRMAAHRRRFLAATLADLRLQLERRGSTLLEFRGRPDAVLPQLAQATGAVDIVCEAIEQPEALSQVEALRAAGVAVVPVWFSSLFDPRHLPFPLHDMPRHFTPFRQAVERARVHPGEPLAPPAVLPPAPALPAGLLARFAPGPPSAPGAEAQPWQGDARSSFPYHLPAYAGGESAALAHLDRYFAGTRALAYKSTRNMLAGTDNSTKFSPWLALGALSPRRVLAALQHFEAGHGSSEGSYAIWFEMLWRDFFRLLVLRERARLALAGPGGEPPPGGTAGAPERAPERSEALDRWRDGRTGVPLVDAAMRELAATGFLCNRLRQIVASHLIHELRADPRGGAAWFAAQLVDYDAYSNDGNWHYIAGTGADPRGGRRFNIEKQTRDHDPDGQFRVLWGAD